MYWTYLGEVFKRAFAPTVRVTDGLQIAAASALPAIGKFAGVKMPASISNDALSYIGAAALAFIAIRLFWAPYAIWKDQIAESAGLKLELSKPERLELEHLSIARANHRLTLAGEFRLLYDTYCEMIKMPEQRAFPSALMTQMQKSLAMSGSGNAVLRCYGLMIRIGILLVEDWKLELLDDSRKIAHLAVNCLNGKMSDDALWNELEEFNQKYPDLTDQLLQRGGIATETQP